MTMSFAVQPGPEGAGESATGKLPKLVYRRWSGAVNVPDPVAISVADNGEVYVTQTQRRKIQDLDIRAHSSWVPDDVGLASVADKREFYHRALAIGGDQTKQKNDVEDVNQDGQHDWRDLTVISEKIHRLVDSDGDGTADQSNVFAEDFKTEVTGIAAGVMHWDGSVWATIAPDVWKLTDTNGDGVADQREIMATGFGLHIAYAGHDMHGLTIGPDGKVYWSIGDKGISVTTKDGRQFQYPNQGGVMRCNPDGSDFEVFAHGLRNVQEFAFDPFGNVFGVDNDADQPGEKERFVWIVDAMDAGWRCNYQYRGGQYNPWTDEKLWQIAGDNHPAYIIPPIQHYYDGPAGFKFNPGAALSSAYQNFFFSTGAPNGSQYAFRAEPHGDSFRMVDSHTIGSGDPIVGIAFGPDGGLYGADWGGGYPLTQSGSVIRIDVAPADLSDQDKANRQSVVRWLNSDMNQQSTEVLVGLLSHVDQRVRLQAQFALVDQGQADAFRQVLGDSSADQLARVHSVWGLGQLARAAATDANVLVGTLSDPDARIRAVAAKTHGEIPGSDPAGLVHLLNDSDLHVRVYAALALGRRPTAAAVKPLLEGAAKLDGDQFYLRHALVTALAACATPDQLAEQANADAESLRLCAVVALRRQSEASVAAFLSDRSDWVASEAARAIHDDFSIADALPALAESLDSERNFPVPLTLRSINANFRLGTAQAANRVMQYAVDRGRPTEMRLAACESIAQWADPPRLDRVDGRSRIANETRQFDRAAIGSALAGLVTDADTALRVAAVKAARELEIDLGVRPMIALAIDRKSPSNLRVEAIKSLTRGDTKQSELLSQLASDSSSPVATQAIESLVEQDPSAALTVIQQRLNSKTVAVRQACVAALAALANESADATLIELGHRFADGSLSEALRLDVWNALQSRQSQSPELKQLLQRLAAGSALATIESDKFKAFALCGEGGDADRGEEIFRTDLRAQCSRCHRTGKKGSDIGPELSKIAKKRDANYLLRALVYPSADIDDKYNMQTLLLADGSVVQGVIQSEDDDTTVLVNQQGETIQVASDDIEDVAKKKLSLMPDMTDVLQPHEVRDLVAYLKSLK
ncbi:PVC-type heme-binding CxxCH protein [Stieleria tagensis]|uniref:PVC-type heme-binding CxxCH protein n=1 Tax=Stieleria tagensis TaxID=2956795 RepID=UPI00209AE764|nr:PVC-type heme-binding CxxCH protein [Stieleria tagensis]